MSRLIESIQVLNGQLINWSFHVERIRLSLIHLYGSLPTFNFDAMKKEAMLQKGKVKLRICYDDNSYSYDFQKYQLKQIRSLQVIHDNDIDYSFKFENREKLDVIYNRRNDADDILIIKNGQITDSYYCNVALLKNGLWFTPLNPLLKGTKRNYLIRSTIIRPKQIHVEDLHNYSSICLFNALIDFRSVVLPTSRIQF